MIMTIARTRLIVASMALSGLATFTVTQASALPAGCSQSGQTVTCTFTSGSNAVPIPVGTSSVHVIAVGGAGSANDVTLQTSRGMAAQPIPGGRGARVEGEVAVTEGTTLYAVVGGNATGSTFTTRGGGANGGGNGRGVFDGNGGGASDVRTSQNDLGSRLLVAAGGGGAGSTGDDGVVSAGPIGTFHDGGRGGDAGANGGTGANDNFGDRGGGGGLAPVGAAGGKGGIGGSGGGGRVAGCNGDDGSLGQGGAGALGTATCGGGGGGAGGGLYGGGGGGAAEFRNPPQNSTTVASGGNGGGAGGSSLVPAGGSFSLDTTSVPTIVLSFVVKAAPSISTQASAGNLLGAPVWDVATLAGGATPTGTVTFRLFSEGTCATLVFTSTNNLSGSTATSDSYTPTAAGTYYWTAVYNGDGNNLTATSACQAAGESVVISPFAPPPPTRSITGDLLGPVTVNAGESVLISSARVVGPVTVNPGGALTVVGSQIARGITANAPSFFSVCGSKVAGPTPAPTTALTVANAPVPIQVGNPASGCAGNQLAGQAVVTSNLAVTFGANVVSQGATIATNGGGNTVVKANTLYGTLACAGNNPAPTNAGQPNTAPSKTGQCAGL